MRRKACAPRSILRTAGVSSSRALQPLPRAERQPPVSIFSASERRNFMSAFLVYGIPGSPYLRSLLAGLEEKGLPYHLTALAPGQHKSPEHLERHPFGRIPVLDHGDFRLYETQAILRYLDAI